MNIDSNILKKIRLEDLFVFQVLTTNENYSVTAKILDKTQGTISSQIKRLEDLFKTELISRTSKSFEITEEGKKLLDFTNSVLNNFEELWKKIVLDRISSNEKFSGIIKLTSSTIPGEHILPKIMAEFKKIYDEVNFELHLKNSKSALLDLENSDIYFASIGKELKSKEKRIFDSIVIGYDQLVFICSKNHPILKESNIDLSKIYQYEFVLRERGSGTRKAFEESIFYNPNIKVGLELDSNQGIITSLMNTNYISIISSYTIVNSPNLDINRRINEIEIIKPIDYTPIKREFHLVKRKNIKDSELFIKFWQFCKEYEWK